MSENNPDTLNLSVTQFFDILSKSRIVASDKLNAVKNQLNRTGSRLSTNQLVDKLIDAGLITRWQSKKLLMGRHKGFFLGKYKLLDHLGTGGMSTVYLAQQSLTRQQRAIKVLPRRKLNDRSYLPRFYQEARSIAALNHPNIIRIFDINHQNNIHYMVMEYVQGRDLYDEVTDHGPVSFELARDCIRQAAEGLAHAHDLNLIHRDIKPANLFRTEAGIVKVLDLGLALLKSDDEDHGLSKQFNESTMGTADYLSPEQAVNSHAVDHRTDIYSLGCTLYFLLTGQPPFNEGSLAQRIAKHQTIMPANVSTLRPDCPDRLERICMKMMAKDPDDRFDNCRELIDELKINDEPTTAVISIDTTPTPDAIKKPDSLPLARTTNRARLPWQMIALLLLLLVIPAVLATYVFQSNEHDEPEKMSSRIETSIPSEDVTNDLAINSVQQQPDGPLIRVDATTVNFESDVGFGNSRSGWDLSKFSVQGQLKSDGHARIVETPGGHADKIGSRVLRIRGNSEEVEFVPNDKKNVKLDRIQFLAMRENDDSSLVAIEAKSTERFEKWQEIAILTDQIDASGFNPVVIDDEVLSKVANPQKFRFKIGGNKDNGIFVDLLKIDLR